MFLAMRLRLIVQVGAPASMLGADDDDSGELTASLRALTAGGDGAGAYFAAGARDLYRFISDEVMPPWNMGRVVLARGGGKGGDARSVADLTGALRVSAAAARAATAEDPGGGSGAPPVVSVGGPAALSGDGVGYGGDTASESCVANCNAVLAEFESAVCVLQRAPLAGGTARVALAAAINLYNCMAEHGCVLLTAVWARP